MPSIWKLEYFRLSIIYVYLAFFTVMATLNLHIQIKMVGLNNLGYMDRVYPNPVMQTTPFCSAALHHQHDDATCRRESESYLTLSSGPGLGDKARSCSQDYGIPLLRMSTSGGYEAIF